MEATADQVKDGFDKHMRLSEAGLVDSVELVKMADGELLSAALCGRWGGHWFEKKASARYRESSSKYFLAPRMPYSGLLLLREGS